MHISEARLGSPSEGLCPTGNFFQEEETCNYLNERRWEEYSLECHLTGFPELGAISGHPKHTGQHRGFNILGNSGYRGWGNRPPKRNFLKSTWNIEMASPALGPLFGREGLLSDGVKE